MRVLIWARFSTHHFAIRNVIVNICDRLNLDKENTYTILTNKKHKNYFSTSDNVCIKTIDSDPDDAIKNHLYSLFILPFYALFGKYELVIFPQITFYWIKTTRILFYIHDLIEYKFDNQKRFALGFRKYFYKRITKISNHIITISKNSKNDIVGVFNYKKENISVLYCGRDKKLAFVEKPLALKKIYAEFTQLHGIEDYLLYVGYLAHPQKNLLFVLDCVVDILRNNNYYFILIGPDGKDAILIHEKIDEINRSLEKNRILAIGTVNKDMLPYFYSAAKCFLFPSLYEGFGMPVIEAMACGCPVITSNTSSLKEIAENFAELIDPTNINEFKKTLDSVVKSARKDDSFYAEHLKQFTWESHVTKLIGIINLIGKK